MASSEPPTSAEPAAQPKANPWNGRHQLPRDPEPPVVVPPAPAAPPAAPNAPNAPSQGPSTARPGNGNNATVKINLNSGVPFGHVPGYLPGSSSLVEELDQRVLIVFRDGRHLLGILRSFDQFSNMMLEDAIERNMHRSASGETCFADIPLGIYMVRGENIVLLGKVSETEPNMKKVTIAELKEMKKRDAASNKEELDFDQDLLA
eukprot:Nitzschia sp. Nitz4//scaffold19_size178191//113387//114110//NITZ4_001991-RA/size178191-snap-gene-0.163-mRNA-1//-1//CDS//3329540723//6970//frame0